MGVGGAESGNKMILEGAYGSFSCIDAVFFWGYSLELDIVFGKCLFEVV